MGEMIESLESRRLYSAGTTSTVKTIHETAGTAFTADLGVASPALTPAASAPTTNTSTVAIHALIHWGDGKTSTATVVANSAGGYDIDGTHTYVKTGRYHIVVFVSRYATGTGPQPQFIQLFKTLHDVAEVSAAV